MRRTISELKSQPVIDIEKYVKVADYVPKVEMICGKTLGKPLSMTFDYREHHDPQRRKEAAILGHQCWTTTSLSWVVVTDGSGTIPASARRPRQCISRCAMWQWGRIRCDVYPPPDRGNVWTPSTAAGQSQCSNVGGDLTRGAAGLKFVPKSLSCDFIATCNRSASANIRQYHLVGVHQENGTIDPPSLWYGEDADTGPGRSPVPDRPSVLVPATVITLVLAAGMFERRVVVRTTGLVVRDLRQWDRYRR